MKKLLLTFWLAIVSVITLTAATKTVTEITDNGTGATTGSLSWAINTATDGDTIVFNLSSGDVVTLSAALPTIDKSFTMEGINNATGNRVTIQVASPGVSPFRVFFFNTSVSGKTITFNDLILRGGDISGLTSGNNYGGVIRCSSGTLNLNRCVIRDGKANSGGGIYSGNTYLNINQCTLNNNIATTNGGGIYTNSSTAILNTTICNNIAATNGGGVHVYRPGVCKIINTTISANTGGGVYCLGINAPGPSRAYCYVLNSIIINNNATYDVSNNSGYGSTYRFYVWSNAASQWSVTNANAPNKTDTYTAGNLGSLSNNGGATPTMQLSSTAPAYQTGSYSYYNATDGYYCKGTDNLYYKFSNGGSTTFTPASANPENDKITTDQRGETRNNPPSMGAYDGSIASPEIDVKQGTTAIASGTGAYDFGSHAISTHTDIDFSIENTGTAASTLGSFTITGADAGQFSFEGTNPSTVANGSSATFTVRFTPTSAGVKTATVLFDNQDSDENPYSFTITGTGAGSVTSTFTGTGNWNQAARWGNGIPGVNDHAVIAGTLTITTPVTVANITVEDGASILGNENLTVTDSTQAKRTITPNVWHLMSSSVNGAKANSFYNNNLPPVYLQVFNNDGTWTGITDRNYDLVNGEGYSIWADNAIATATFNGSLNYGAITVPVLLNTGLYGGGGFNLLGNPYPSAIDLDVLYSINTQSSSFYTWNQANGQYSTYNAQTQIGQLGATNIIPANQGFFVNVVAAGNYTFMDAYRTHSTTPLVKSTPANILRLKVQGNNLGDEAVITFNSNATNHYDFKFDSRKLMGSGDAPQMYTVANGEKLSINSLSELIPNTSVSVPMNLEVGADGNYMITASELNSFTVNTTVYLIDSKTNQTINMSQNPVYSFTANTGDNANRFTVLFAAASGINSNNADNLVIFSHNNDVFVTNKGNETIREIQITNALGQQIVKTGTESRISLNVEIGYYFVKVITSGKTYTQKVFIH